MPRRPRKLPPHWRLLRGGASGSGGSTIRGLKLLSVVLACFFVALMLLRGCSTRGSAARSVRPTAAEPSWRALRETSHGRTVEPWAESVERVEAALRAAGPEAFPGEVGLARQAARRVGEQRLVASASASSSEAERLLGEAERLGEALRALGGDAWLAEAVAEFRAAPPTRARALRGAWAEYGRALASFPGRCEEALPAFGTAAARLGAERSALDLKLAFHQAACWHLLADYPRAQQGFRALGEQDLARFPALRGHLAWAEGLLAFHQGRFEEALGFQQLAVQRFAELGEAGHLAVVRGLEAEAVAQLGRLEEARAPLLAAWRDRAAIAEVRQREALRYTAARLAEVAGEPKVALELLSAEALAPALVADPVSRAELEVRRAQLSALRAELLARLGRGTEGEVALRDELRALRAAPPTPLRARLVADLLLALGTQGVARADELVEAWEIYDQASYRPRCAQTALALAALEPTSRTWLDQAGAEIDSAVAASPAPLADLDLRTAARRVAAARLAFALDVEHDARRAWNLVGWARGAPARTPLPPAGSVGIVYAALPGDRLVALLAREGRVVRVPLDATGAAIAADVEALRAGLREGSPAGALDAGFERLQRLLLAPLEGLLPASGRLILAPEGSVAGVPFAALHAPGGKSLLERFELSYTAQLPTTALPARSFDGEGWLLVAASQPDARLGRAPSLPSAEADVAALAPALRAPVLLFGPAATKAAMRAALPDARVVHFAGHAQLVPEQPRGSFLWLAASAEAPGALTLEEIAGLDLRGLELAVLGACRSAQRAAPERALSLARAFHVAGAQRVVGSLWDVEDAPISRLFQLFYRNLQAGQAPGAALREAQLACLHSTTEPELASPAVWAGLGVWER